MFTKSEKDEIRELIRTYGPKVIPAGPEGPQGPKGDTGPQGPAGKDATSPVPTPTPVEPPVTSMIVGIDAGNYGIDAAKDVRACVPWVRADAERGPTMFANFKTAGLQIDCQFPGPYNTGGVKALNPGVWAANALAFYKANCPGAKLIEVLNEPGGTWFWGSSAVSPENGIAYRKLLEAIAVAFTAEYGADRPKILATVDGSGGLAFGKAWWTPDMAAVVDGVIVHPYGGTGSKATSALGNHKIVEEAHALTGLHVYITEVGWPTAVGQSATNDSLQWSEAEQASNITNFITWCRTQPYIAAIFYFNWRDYGSNDWYGVVRTDGSHKPSYAALHDAAQLGSS